MYAFWFEASGWARGAEICVTTGWLQAAGVTNYTVPNLATANGWQANWGQPVTAPLYYAGGEAADYTGTPCEYLRSNSEPLTVGTNFVSRYAGHGEID